MPRSGNEEPDLEGTGQLSETANVDRLDSWKEIAAYLNRSVRTVQRWEAERGLPVHRVPGRDHGSVNALKTEIDDWFSSSEDLESDDHPDEAPETEHEVSGQIPASADRWPRHLVAVCLLLGAVLGASILALVSGTFSRQVSPAAGQPTVKKFTIIPETGFRDPVISPDGTMIAYVSGDQHQQLVIHSLKTGGVRRYPGTERAINPFWSPNSDFVGFAAGPDLKKISISSGIASTICQLPTRMFNGGTWAADSRSIIFDVLDYPNDFYIVDANGGIPRRLNVGVPSTYWPHQLIDAGVSSILLFNTGPKADPDPQYGGSLFLFDALDGQTKYLGKGRRPVYSRTKHLLYERRDSPAAIWAQAFSPKTLEVIGSPFPVAQNAFSPSVSNDGTLVYAEIAATGKSQLVWRDRRGAILGTIGQPQNNITFMSLSPDGQKVVVGARENSEYSVWIHDVYRPHKERLTFGPKVDTQPIWSPSGDSIAFSSRPPHDHVNTDILVKRVDQTSNEATLLATEFPERASDWISQGNRILYYVFRPRKEGGDDSEIWYLEPSGEDGRFNSVRYLGDPEVGCCAKFSPNGKYIVYSSDETGRMEVWASPFPHHTTRWKVSDAGGRQPRWSKSGKEIFYVEGDMLVSVPVNFEPSFTIGQKEQLFRSDLFARSFLPQYDDSLDGKRFVVAEPVPSDHKPVIRIVLNWFEEFR